MNKILIFAGVSLQKTMVTFTTTLQKFGEKGEKTGWTYFQIPFHIANELNPNTRTSYRVKGKIDNFAINQVALLPMGEGDFIIPYNATFRKNVGKKEGAMVNVSLEIDTSEFVMSADLMACLEDEPKALETFLQQPKSHQKYFSTWIEQAKTIETKSKRISQAVRGLAMGMNYGEMMRYFKAKDW